MLRNIRGKQIQFCFNKISKSPLSNFNNYNPEKILRSNKQFKIIEHLPSWMIPYFKLGRYDRPSGYLLLYIPCTWGLAIGAPCMNLEFYKFLFLMLSGAILMRSSGCIINDMWDRDLDKSVERCKERPLASGALTFKQATIFLILHLIPSLWILLQFPIKSIINGFLIMPVVLIYPYMKRVTFFPQFFLGLAFNSGCIIGASALTGVLDIYTAGPLYLAGILWTLIYDTIYAHMDKTDDIKINVKSTAILFDENSKLIFTILAFSIGGIVYWLVNYKSKSKDKKLANFFLLSALGLQFYSIFSVNLSSPISCLKHFNLNRYFGLLIFLSLYFANK